MDKALLDTDMLSEVLKAVDANVVTKATTYRAAFGRYTISVITLMEIVKGHHKMQREDRIQAFLNALATEEVLAFDGGCAEQAGRIYGDLERTGQTIGRADPMIAAIALQHGLTLATGNTNHYQRIQALGYPLQLEDWRQP